MFVKQTDIVGKVVVGPDGNSVGTVKELTFTLKGEIGFLVSKPGTTDFALAMSSCLAIGEFILIGAPAVPPTPTTASSVRVEAVTVPWSVAPGPAPATARAPPSAGCAKCGKGLKPGARFCAGCGAKVAVPA